jgi:hypothetical protein
MKTSSTTICQPTSLNDSSIMDELAIYNLARNEAKDIVADSEQTGTKVFGFEDGSDGYEITAAPPEELAEYNLDLAIVAPDTEFNLIVRKDNANALHKMSPTNLRNYLRRILDSV